MKRLLESLSHVMAASHYAFMSSGKDEPNLQFIIDFIPIEYTLLNTYKVRNHDNREFV